MWKIKPSFLIKKANVSHSCNTQYICLSIPLHFLSNRVLYLQITLLLFESRVFLCKADCVYLQNTGFVCIILSHNLLHKKMDENDR